MSLLQQYEARLIGESKTEATRNLYLGMAKRLSEFAGGMEAIDEQKVLLFRDHLASMVEPSSMIAYVYGLNHFAAYLGLKVRMKAPMQARKAKEVPTKQEFLRLLQAAKTQHDPYQARRDLAVLLVMGEGGARGGEVRNFLLKDLNLEAGYILARCPKGKHDRKIVFGEATRLALMEWMEVRGDRTPKAEEHLFLTLEGERILAPQTLARMVGKLAFDARIDRVRMHPHMLRRYRITELSMAGLGLWDLMAFAGHSNIKSTQEYVVVDEKEMMRKVQSLPAISVEERPYKKPENKVENRADSGADPEAALIERLAKGDISEETFNRAMRGLDRRYGMEVLR